jgi:hypothetical protein
MGEAEEHTRKSGKWFYQTAHYLYPCIGLGADYSVNENWDASLDLRAWFPVTDSPESWRLGITLRAAHK